MKFNSNPFKRTLVVAMISSTIILASITDAEAGRALRKGIKGAAAGALIGAALGGGDGAAKGAMIGGGVGIIAGSGDNKRHRRNKGHKKHRKRAKQHKRRR